jgi:hypothetical protein
MNKHRSPPISRRWSIFYRRCLISLARTFYKWYILISLRQLTDPIMVVCISDTHTTQPQLPGGDLLLHAGDLSQTRPFAEIQAQLDWLNSQPHKHKVVIGGNHDLLLDSVFVDRFPERIFERPGASRSDLKWGNIIYLQDSSVSLTFGNGRKLKIYGSPNTQQFGNWAFQYPPIRDVWTGVVPLAADVLLMHGPPRWHLDANALGDDFLLQELRRVNVKLVVFGRIHAGYGREVVQFNRVGNAFEDIVFRRKRLWLLAKMAPYLLNTRIFGGRIGSRPKVTELVNAAVVGGRHNEETRDPIIVHI